MPLELGLSYIVYLKKDVITRRTFSTLLVVGSVIKVIKSTMPLLENLLVTSFSKSTHLEVKQGPIKQSQAEAELEESLQALSQKPNYPFHVQRNSALQCAVVLEATHWNSCVE